MRKKWIFITAACVAFVILTTVLSVLIFQFRHEHQLGDAKVYHIYNDRIYYTRQCAKDNYSKSIETDLTFAEVVENLGNADRIILEEDITASQIFNIRGYLYDGGLVERNRVVNIDLNNNKIYSMFNLDAAYGSIKFNISNGIIESNYVNAIKATGENGKIEVNITNVECSSVGDKNAPLYIENIYEVSINAYDSDFVSKNKSLPYDSYGVGVFINSKGNFKFENCLLDGGDGLHVREGNISLKGCDLVNTGLITQLYQSVDTGFSAVGASLAAHCYTSGNGTTNFEITIENCEMITNNSNRVMYVYAVARSGYEASLNSNSCIKIKSCKFDENPNEFGTLDAIIYVDGSQPENDGYGYWVYGDVNK